MPRPKAEHLSIPQLHALENLPFLESDAQVAKAAGVHVNTLAKWKQDPMFMEEYHRVKSRMSKRLEERQERAGELASKHLLAHLQDNIFKDLTFSQKMRLIQIGLQFAGIETGRRALGEPDAIKTLREIVEKMSDGSEKTTREIEMGG